MRQFRRYLENIAGPEAQALARKNGSASDHITRGQAALAASEGLESTHANSKAQ